MLANNMLLHGYNAKWLKWVQYVVGLCKSIIYVCRIWFEINEEKV